MPGQQATLRDGSFVVIRPIEPDDRDQLAAGFERLSPESRYRRFFSPVSRLTDRQLDYLTRVDHRDHEALVAFDRDRGHIVGVARYVRTGPGEAEPAIVVADDWQGRGVASILLARLVDRALDEGISWFNAPVLSSNAEAIALLRRLGDSTATHRGAEVELRIALEPLPRPAGPLRTVLRAAAAGTVDPALTFWHRLLPRGRTARGGPSEERANVVVVAVDQPDGSDAAVTLARRIASAAASEVVVVAARHPLDDRAAVEQRARRIAAQLRGHGLRARDVVRGGELGAVVLDVAAEEAARLIVIADSPDPHPAGRLLGEPWDHISHHAPCSVLVAR